MAHPKFGCAFVLYGQKFNIFAQINIVRNYRTITCDNDYDRINGAKKLLH